ncbi:MAG: GSCFA domain-containing protein, partial [Bacteroidales bacterium]
MDDKQQHDLFRTEITPEPLKPKISYQDQVMLIGSCFTEHIGDRLANYKLTTDLNPFGIVYNPLSIASQINALLDPAAYSESDLIHHLDL